MSDGSDTVTVHVNVELTPQALQTIVAQAKKIAGCDAKGIYRIDTADKVAQMISKFLHENDFESYVKDIDHYR
jgi:hypothetical protein